MTLSVGLELGRWGRTVAAGQGVQGHGTHQGSRSRSGVVDSALLGLNISCGEVRVSVCDGFANGRAGCNSLNQVKQIGRTGCGFEIAGDGSQRSAAAVQGGDHVVDGCVEPE